MNQPLNENTESSRTSRSLFWDMEPPPDYLRVTRSQTKAAREELQRQMQTPIRVEEEPFILPTHYPIRRHPVKKNKKTHARKSKRASKKVKRSRKNKRSVPPVTQVSGDEECKDNEELNKPAPVARSKKPKTKNKHIQTEFMIQTDISESEMKLLNELRATRINIDRARIIPASNGYFLTDDTDDEIEEIDLTARNNNMPTPPFQMLNRPGSSFLPQSISRESFSYVPPWFWDIDSLQDLLSAPYDIRNHFCEAAGDFITAPLRGDTSYFNQYGMPGRYPKTYYPFNGP